MNINHDLPGCAVRKDDCGKVSFNITNGIGGFFFETHPKDSKFNGLFLKYDDGLYKTVDSIGIAESEALEIEHHESYIRRKHLDNVEELRLPQDINGMRYSLSKKAEILVDLDCRRVNDLRNFGRIYTTRVEDKRVIVKFTKQTDHREDSTDGLEEFNAFIAFEPKDFDPHSDMFPADRWHEEHYSYDTERNDPPDNRYVHNPFRIRTKSMLIACGRTKEDALSELERLKGYNFKRRNRRHHDTSNDPPEDNAFTCAKASLGKAKVLHAGITRLYAGYPWFFQFWSRDENISLGALIKLHNFDIVKDILMQYMHNIGTDGRLPNRLPSSDLKSADGIGWFWKRMSDFIDELDRSDLVDTYLSKKEIEDIIEHLGSSISGINDNHIQEGFVICNTNETWMDTQWQAQDGRSGARIEIQALHLNMLDLMYRLSDDEQYKKMEDELRQKVVERFWNDGMLADGLDDWTIRPNVFIAHYVYPELISQDEWKTCFSRALDKLWLGWGGLSSIETDHPLFTDRYTGANNQSYHRGDSWYWINNLAALCMHRADKDAFKDKVEKIVAASSEEILWHGSVGDHAEVSSAAQLESKGCLAQTWSSAMFIELMMELKRRA